MFCHFLDTQRDTCIIKSDSKTQEPEKLMMQIIVQRTMTKWGILAQVREAGNRNGFWFSLFSIQASVNWKMPSHTKDRGQPTLLSPSVQNRLKSWSCPETPSTIDPETVFWFWHPRSSLKTCKRNHQSWGADKSFILLKPFYRMSNEKNMKNFRFS